MDTESEIVYDLQPVVYDYKKGHGNIKNEFGFIAEDVADLLPSMVNYDLENTPISLNYSALHAPVIKELQNHHAHLKTYQSIVDQQATINGRYANLLKEQQGMIDDLYAQQNVSLSTITALASLMVVSSGPICHITPIDHATYNADNNARIIHIDNTDKAHNVTLNFPKNPYHGQIFALVLDKATHLNDAGLSQQASVTLISTVPQEHNSNSAHVAMYMYDIHKQEWLKL